MKKTARRALRATAAVVGTYATVIVAAAYAWRRLQLNELGSQDVDAVIGDADETDEADDVEMILDPRVLSWMRELPCGVRINAATGRVTPLAYTPYGTMHVVMPNTDASNDVVDDNDDTGASSLITQLIDDLMASLGNVAGVVDLGRLPASVPEFARNDDDPAVVFGGHVDDPDVDVASGDEVSDAATEEHT